MAAAQALNGEKILDGTLIAPGRKAAAEQRAERIMTGLAVVAEDYAQAVLDKDWEAMGLTQREWRDKLLGDTWLTAATRKRVHELLSGEGLGMREIAVATGASKSTVQRDVAQVSHSGTASETDADQALGVTPVTPESPRTGAERVREHRERKRREEAAGPLPAPEPVQDPEVSNALDTSSSPEPVPEPPAPLAFADLPEAEQARVREEIRAEVKAGLMTELWPVWEQQLALAREQAAPELEREAAGLREQLARQQRLYAQQEQHAQGLRERNAVLEEQNRKLVAELKGYEKAAYYS